MEIQEAIKLLKKYIEHPWSIEVGGEDANKFKEIVDLLKRGEKEKSDNIELTDENQMLKDYIQDLLEDINKLKRKQQFKGDD